MSPKPIVGKAELPHQANPAWLSDATPDTAGSEGRDPARPRPVLSVSSSSSAGLFPGSTWQSWTMVTTGVPWLTAPIDTIMAYSRSA